MVATIGWTPITAMEFRTSLLYQMIESLIVGAILGGITMLAIVFVEAAPWGVSSLIGLGVCLFIAGIYTLRFVLKGTQKVKVETTCLVMESRLRQTSLAWNEVKEAFHESDHGLRWRFETGTETVILRDDGFRSRQWDDITLAITACLEKHQILINRDSYGELYNQSVGDKDPEA